MFTPTKHTNIAFAIKYGNDSHAIICKHCGYPRGLHYTVNGLTYCHNEQLLSNIMIKGFENAFKEFYQPIMTNLNKNINIL